MSEPIPCLLCKVRRSIKRCYDDRIFWVADCLHCGKPIIVYREHQAVISERKMEKALKIAKDLFGESAKFRGHMKLVKGHWHDHILAAATT